MLCPSCQAQIADDSAFCKNCGGRVAPLKAPLQAGAPPVAPGAPPAGQPAPGPRAPEADLWQGSTSLKAFVLEFLGLGLLGIALLAGFAVVKSKWFSYGVLLALAVWGISILVRFVAARLSLRYRLTTERLFRQRGFFRRVSDEIELIRVDDVEVQQNFLQRVVDVGTVVVVSSDRTDSRLRLEGIEGPMKLKELIREYTRRIRGRALYVESV